MLLLAYYGLRGLSLFAAAAAVRAGPAHQHGRLHRLLRPGLGGHRAADARAVPRALRRPGAGRLRLGLRLAPARRGDRRVRRRGHPRRHRLLRPGLVPRRRAVHARPPSCRSRSAGTFPRPPRRPPCRPTRRKPPPPRPTADPWRGSLPGPCGPRARWRRGPGPGSGPAQPARCGSSGTAGSSRPPRWPAGRAARCSGCSARGATSRCASPRSPPSSGRRLPRGPGGGRRVTRQPGCARCSVRTPSWAAGTATGSGASRPTSTGPAGWSTTPSRTSGPRPGRRPRRRAAARDRRRRAGGAGCGVDRGRARRRHRPPPTGPAPGGALRLAGEPPRADDVATAERAARRAVADDPLDEERSQLLLRALLLRGLPAEALRVYEALRRGWPTSWAPIPGRSRRSCTQQRSAGVLPRRLSHRRRRPIVPSCPGGTARSPSCGPPGRRPAAVGRLRRRQRRARHRQEPPARGAVRAGRAQRRDGATRPGVRGGAVAVRPAGGGRARRGGPDTVPVDRCGALPEASESSAAWCPTWRRSPGSDRRACDAGRGVVPDLRRRPRLPRRARPGGAGAARGGRPAARRPVDRRAAALPGPAPDRGARADRGGGPLGRGCRRAGAARRRRDDGPRWVRCRSRPSRHWPAGAGHVDRAAEVMRRTGGHPLFVVEVLRALAHGDPGLPATLQTAVLDRVGRTGEETERLLRAAAVLGSAFDPVLAATSPGHAGSGRSRLRDRSAGRAGRPQRPPTSSRTTSSARRSSRRRHHRPGWPGTPGPPTCSSPIRRRWRGTRRRSGDRPRAGRAWLLAAERALARFAAADAVVLASAAFRRRHRARRRRAARPGTRGPRARARRRDAFGAALEDFTAAREAARRAGDRRLQMTALRELAVTCPSPWAAAGRLRAAAARVPRPGRGPRRPGAWRPTPGPHRAAALAARLRRGPPAGPTALAAGRAADDDRALAHGLDAVKTACAYLGLVAGLLRSGGARAGLRRTGDLWSLQWTVFESSFVPLAAGDHAAALARIERGAEINRRSGYLATESWYLAPPRLGAPPRRRPSGGAGPRPSGGRAQSPPRAAPLVGEHRGCPPGRHPARGGRARRGPRAARAAAPDGSGRRRRGVPPPHRRSVGPGHGHRRRPGRGRRALLVPSHRTPAAPGCSARTPTSPWRGPGWPTASPTVPGRCSRRSPTPPNGPAGPIWPPTPVARSRAADRGSEPSSIRLQRFCNTAADSGQGRHHGGVARPARKDHGSDMDKT